MKYESQIEWERTHCWRLHLQLNKATDQEMIEWLSSQPNKQGYIKQLVKADMARQKEKKMFVIRDREAGNEIDRFETLKEAEETLAQYEAEDKKDGTYTEDFYEIVEK